MHVFSAVHRTPAMRQGQLRCACWCRYRAAASVAPSSLHYTRPGERACSRRSGTPSPQHGLLLTHLPNTDPPEHAATLCSTWQGGCCGSGAKTIDDAELRPNKPERAGPAAAAKPQQQPVADGGNAAAVASGKPAQHQQEQQGQQQQRQQVPNSQQIDGLPESVPVVLPPPDKPDAVAGVPLGHTPQPPDGGAAQSGFVSPFADNNSR